MIEWVEAVDGGAYAEIEGKGRTFGIIISKLQRGFLWEVLDEGSESRLPACEAGVSLTLDEAKAESAKIATRWIS